VLTEPKSSPAFRRVLDRLLAQTEALIATARGLPGGVKSGGLRRESAAIVALAARLARHLRRGDPLGGRVKLGKVDFAMALVAGLFA
ncbi:MAG: squalene/phytoene synthase family protein, partial [Stellaceae bacterium]